MKKMISLGVVVSMAVCAMLASGGCGSNAALPEPTLFSGGRMITEEQARQLEAKITDQDIATVLDANVKPKLPTSLAIARVDAGTIGGRNRCDYYRSDPRLASVTGEEFTGWEQSLAGLSDIRGLRTIFRLPGQSEQVTLHALRASAAGMGCELLLAYMVGQAEVDNYNHAAILYWTIVGLFVVPGSEYQHKTVMQAILVDTRTGVILGTAGGEASAKEMYIPVASGIVRDRLSARTPPEALANLQKNTAAMVRQVVAR